MGIARKREAAKRDLLEQFIWYAENASVEVADRFLQAADATLGRLAEAPKERNPTFHPTRRTQRHAPLASERI